MILVNMNSTHITMEMTSETDINHPAVQWWALHLLELGQKSEYDNLMHWLERAKVAGSLMSIRLATERIVRSRVAKKKPLRKTTGNTTYKAVA